MARRSKMLAEQGVTAGAALVTAGCGLVSVIFIPAAGTVSSVTLYDHASATTGGKMKVLAAGTANTSEAMVYCPAIPDAFANGIFAVVTGEGAKVYISIEPV